MANILQITQRFDHVLCLFVNRMSCAYKITHNVGQNIELSIICLHRINLYITFETQDMDFKV